MIISDIWISFFKGEKSFSETFEKFLNIVTDEIEKQTNIMHEEMLDELENSDE